MKYTSASGDMRFQLTLPRGERPGVAYQHILIGGFNSRSRVGSDPYP